MDNNNFEELSGIPEKRNRAIIDIKEDWPLWQRVVASIINASGVFFWLLVTVVLIYTFNLNPELVGFRNSLLNIIAPAVAYGILSLVAGLSLISWLNPWLSPSRLMKEDNITRLACCIYWAGCVIALAIVIAGVV